MKKRVVVRKSKNTLTPLNRKLLMVLVVIVLAGVVIAVLNQAGLTGNVFLGGTPRCPANHPNKASISLMPTADQDRDGIHDFCDNCPKHSNRNQYDGDKDRVGRVCDGCPPGNVNNDQDSLCKNAVGKYKADPNDNIAKDWVKVSGSFGEVRPRGPAKGIGGGGAVIQPSPRSSP